MLLPGTEMHWVTFGFICAELMILFYFFLYRSVRPHDLISYLDVILIGLLLLYNVTGGLLPDEKLPGSFFVQMSIAYGTGFITPCYFPYFVYKALDLRKMKFHAYKGVFFFLISPCLLFVLIFYVTGKLDAAKNILIIPVLYAMWVIVSLHFALRAKYGAKYGSRECREEVIVLYLSLTPWVGLPFIAYFDWNQTIEAIATNTGFLLLLALHLKRKIQQLKGDYSKLLQSQLELVNWRNGFEIEVDKRAKQILNGHREERIEFNGKTYRLTKREHEVALWICKGATHRQIGEALFIAERTVAKHVQNIFEKVNVGNRLELCQKLEQ